MTIELCPICGEMAAKHEERRTTYHYKEHLFDIMQLAIWCDSCSEVVISPEDNKTTALKIREHRSRMDGVLTPGEIAKKRKHLNLNQEDAGRLFGGGINPFNRYERRTNPILKPLSMLLVLLDKHPEQLQELLVCQLPNPSEYSTRSL